MRRRSKVLAFVLAMLMIVGMLPLSVFAAAGDTSSSDSSTVKPQTREEWVKAQGGKMLFGSSFDNPDKIVENGNRVNPESGMGEAFITRATSKEDNATTSIDLVKGALHLTTVKGKNDARFATRAKHTSGKPVAFEVTYQFDNPYLKTGYTQILYYQDKTSFADKSFTVDLLYYNAVSETRGQIVIRDSQTGGMVVLAEFNMGEQVKVSFVFDPVSKRISGYNADGEYVGTVSSYSEMYDRYDDNTIESGDKKWSDIQKKDYPEMYELRWFHSVAGAIEALPQDVYIHDMYIYEGVNQPYGSEYSATGAKGLSGLMSFLRNNDAKYLLYHDFEDLAGNGITLTDGVSDVADKTSLYTPGMANRTFFNALKKSTMTFRSEVKDGDLNSYLRMFNQGIAEDSYVDIYTNCGDMPMTQFKAGETVVVQGSFRKSYASDAITYGLFELKSRGFYYEYEQVAGADTDDTSDDRYVRVGTEAKDLDISTLFVDYTGNIRLGDVSGKILGKLSADGFGDVAVIIDPTNNTYSVAIDGKIVKTEVKLISDEVVLSKTLVETTETGASGEVLYKRAENPEWNTGMYCPSECRITAKSGLAVKGYLDMDNLFVYCGGKVSSENFYVSNNIVGEPNTWQQNAEGYWRYFGVDGKPVTGKQTIDGKSYIFTGDGYFATVEKEYLVKFDAAGSNGASAQFTNTNMSQDVKFGWKYSSLWTNIFYDNAPGMPNAKYGKEGIEVPITNSSVNPKFKRNLTAEEEAAYGLDTSKSYSVFDFGDYAGMEIDWYVDKAVDMTMKIPSEAHNKVSGSTTGTGIYSKYDGLKNTKSGTAGWKKTVLNLTNGFTSIDGDQNEVMDNRNLNMAKQIRIRASWDSSNANKYLNNVKIYIARIDLVKYVPAKLDVSPATLESVREIDGKVYVYADNMSVPSVGWVTVGTDKYYCTPDGVAQTGAVLIGEVTYEFDDFGKLVGNADGVYTINGKNYYFKDGARKIGMFNATINGKQVTVNTLGDGEIEDIRGVVPGFTVGSSVTPDYETLLAGKNVIAKNTFDTLVTELPEYSEDVVYTGNVPFYTDSTLIGTEGVDRLGMYDDKYIFGWVIRKTRFHSALDSIRPDGTKDVALRLYNECAETDLHADFNIYQNLVAYGTQKPIKNVVLDASVKIGEDWDTTTTLFTVNDRSADASKADRDQGAGGGIYLNRNGYAYIGDTILCKLSTTEYTRFSIVHIDDEGAYGTVYVYVNGVKVYKHVITNSNFDAPTMFRFAYFQKSHRHGSLYVDDIYMYEGTEPVAVDTTSEVKNGVVTENGVSRYFVDGAAKTGEFTVIEGGVHNLYKFDAANGIGAEGFSDVGYYYANGMLVKHEGVTTIDGVDYYFGSDYKIVKNGSVADHLDPSKIYKTDANGVIIYKGVVDNTTYSDADDIANTPNYSNGITDGQVYFDAEIGMNVFMPDSRDSDITLFKNLNGLNLSNYEFLRVKLYVRESLKDITYAFIIGNECMYSKVEGFNPETGKYTSIIEGTAVYKVGEGYEDIGNQTYVKKNGGTYDYTDVYVRTWKYANSSNLVKYNFGGKTGWIDILVPLKDYASAFDIATSITLITSEWSLNSGVLMSQRLVVAEAALISYGEQNLALNGWVDGKYYEDGYVKTGWFNYGGYWYYLDPVTGMKTTGIACVPAMPTARSAGSFYYDFGTVGACQGPATGIIDSTEWTYDAEKTVYTEKAVKRIVKDGVIQTGLVTIGDNKYYVDSESYAVLTNCVVIVGNEILSVDENGVITTVFNKWLEHDGKKYYYDAEGKLASGYTSIDGANYYFDPTTNVMLASGWQEVYGTPMFFGADGKAADGITVNEALTEADGYLYNTGCFDNGVPVSGDVTDGSYKYVFVNGKLTSKIAIGTDAPEILVRVIKDGKTNIFYLKAETKKFEAYACYTLEIYDMTSGAPVKLDITDNTLVIAKDGKSHTFEVRYTPVPHTYEKKAELSVAPSCNANGYDTYVCTLCGDSYKEVVLANREHVYGDWVTQIAPTCLHEGLKVRTCDCGAYETEVLERNPNGHSIIKNGDYYYYKPETCTGMGYESGVCKWCGERLTLKEISARGHDYENVVWTVDKVATCISMGVMKGTCGRADCDEVIYKTIPVDPNYHGANGTITHQNQAGDDFSLFKIVVPSTCRTPGSGIFRCLDCGAFIGDENDPKSLIELELDPDNHEWGDKYLVVMDGDKVIETVKIVEEGGVKYVVSYDENGDVISKVTAPAEITDTTFTDNSKYGCGYVCVWRQDCINDLCVKNGVRISQDIGTIQGAAHSVDLDKIYTTIDKNDPLYGMHYHVCTKCEKAIHVKPHVMSSFEISADGKTHIVYCEDGCIIETEGTELGKPYSVTEDCDHKIVQVTNGGVVVGHVERCKCGHEQNPVDHANIKLTHQHSADGHFEVCVDCGYRNELTLNITPAQTATCWQSGWDAFGTCECGYVEPHTVYNQLPHNISATIVGNDPIGHYYKCLNANCDYKHLLEAHSMIEILATPATCETSGTVHHMECSVCGWCDPNSFSGDDYANYPDGIIPALGHNPSGEYHYDDTEHWQFCDREGCGAVIRGDHTYKTNTNLENYDDENGTAVHKCDTCEYRKPLTGLATWYGVLGLDKGEDGNYYLYVNGVKMTNYLAKLPDGSYRYFDNDGKLVMNVASYGDKQFNSITEFGPDGLTNLIGAITYEGTQTLMYPNYTDTQAAKRGAIKNAIIETVDGIMMIDGGVLVTGWKEITVTFDTDDTTDDEVRYYYFNSILNNALVNVDVREGVLIKSESFTIKALSFVNNQIVMDIVNVRADGSLLLGVVSNGDGTASYYLDGTAGKLTGRIEDNYFNRGKIYFANAEGVLYSGKWTDVNGVYYSFNDDYSMEKWHINDTTTLKIGGVDTVIYTDGEGRRIITGWFLAKGVGGKYIKDGVMLTDKESIYIDDIYFKIDSDGLVTHYSGWIDDDHYVSNGMIVKGRREHVGDKYYLFDGDGLLVKAATSTELLMVYYEGWAYSIDADGVMTEYDARTNGPIWVYFMIDGKVSETTKGYYTNTGLIISEAMNIDGKLYIFDLNGHLVLNRPEYEFNNVIYMINEKGEATVKPEDDE